MFHTPNKYRVTTGMLASNNSHGCNGCFIFKGREGAIRCIASDQDGWEHVSVSLAHRTPTWDEMCIVKKLFWDAEDCVIQYHPPESQYINCHPNCLHLWRPIGITIPQPPKEFV